MLLSRRKRDLDFTSWVVALFQRLSGDTPIIIWVLIKWRVLVVLVITGLLFAISWVFYTQTLLFIPSKESLRCQRLFSLGFWLPKMFCLILFILSSWWEIERLRKWSGLFVFCCSDTSVCLVLTVTRFSAFPLTRSPASCLIDCSHFFATISFLFMVLKWATANLKWRKIWFGFWELLWLDWWLPSHLLNKSGGSTLVKG